MTNETTTTTTATLRLNDPGVREQLESLPATLALIGYHRRRTAGLRRRRTARPGLHRHRPRRHDHPAHPHRPAPPPRLPRPGPRPQADLAPLGQRPPRRHLLPRDPRHPRRPGWACGPNSSTGSPPSTSTATSTTFRASRWSSRPPTAPCASWPATGTRSGRRTTPRRPRPSTPSRTCFSPAPRPASRPRHLPARHRHPRCRTRELLHQGPGAGDHPYLAAPRPADPPHPGAQHPPGPRPRRAGLQRPPDAGPAPNRHGGRRRDRRHGDRGGLNGPEPDITGPGGSASPGPGAMESPCSTTAARRYERLPNGRVHAATVMTITGRPAWSRRVRGPRPRPCGLRQEARRNAGLTGKDHPPGAAGTRVACNSLSTKHTGIALTHTRNNEPEDVTPLVEARRGSEIVTYRVRALLTWL